MPTNSIIRVETPNATTLHPRERMNTRRIPGYVPFVVDNLWAWTLPDGFPDRRHSTFASPRAELIEVSGTPYLVHIAGNLNHCIAQIEENDARFHPDCKALPKLLFKLLGTDWVNSDKAAKVPAGQLWMPCLSKDEVEAVFRESALAPHRDEVFAAVTYWKNARLVSLDGDLPYPNGEIFFEADSWHLSEL